MRSLAVKFHLRLRRAMRRRPQIRRALSSLSRWSILRAFLAGLIIGPFLYGMMNGPDDYRPNLLTEALGILLTALVIDWIYEQRARRQLQRRLKREAGSRSNDMAISAVEWLYHEEWLIGDKGLLKGARLAEADLRNAPLRSANLKEADLWKTKMQEADLWWTELHGASLIKAQLQNADLLGAVLLDADLRSAELQGTNLSGADLRGANLTNANLQNAIMRRAKLEGAKLHNVNLNRVDLGKADLKCANLFGANLQDANLDRANLEKANLRNINLENANLSGAYMEGARVSLSEGPVASRQGGEMGEPGSFQFLPPTQLRGATLPDGTPFPEDPSLHDELERFTNPEHHDFPKTLEKIKDIRRDWEIIE